MCLASRTLETSLEAGIPQQNIRVNRGKVADLGLSVRDVTQLLQTAVAGSKAGEYRTERKFAYRILVQLKDAEKRSLDEILNLTLDHCIPVKRWPCATSWPPKPAVARC